MPSWRGVQLKAQGQLCLLHFTGFEYFSRLTAVIAP